jgi:hypothetical protein
MAVLVCLLPGNSAHKPKQVGFDPMHVPNRPFHAMTCVATTAHHLLEVGAGTGLVFQPYIGLKGATALWSIALPSWLAAAARGSSRWDRPLAFLAGLSIGGAAVHFTLWPFEIRKGMPTLVEAEGLRPEQLPAYNRVLYAWAISAAAALAVETPRRARRWALVGALAAVPLRWSARHHFAWIKEQARANPAWWNRALRPQAGDGERPAPYNRRRRDARADEGARLESV